MMNTRIPVPGGKRPTRKDQLLTAAALLFRERGYHRVSMAEIAEAVGITGPALYRHFRNKHDVLVQSLNAQLALVEDLVAKVRATEGSSEERMSAYLSALKELVLDREDVFLWKRERVHLSGDERSEFRGRLHRLSADTVGLIRDLRPDLDASDAELLSWGVLALFSNTRMYHSVVDDQTMGDTVDRMARAVLACDLAEAPQMPPRIRQQPPLAAGARRERLLETATDLFHRSGYDDVTVEQIAGAAEIPLATVYQLYPGKADILRAILTRGIEGTSYVTAHRLAMAASSTPSIKTITAVYAELACGIHGRMLRIVERDAVALPEESYESCRLLQREYVEQWVQALSAARPELDESEAGMLANGAVGLVTEISQMPGMQRRPNLEGELLAMACAVLRG